MAKLTYFQLEAQLAKPLAPLYLISGEDPLLKQDAIRLLRAAATKAGITEQLRFDPEAQHDWEQVYGLLYASSLLADKQFIEVNLHDHAPNKTATAFIQEYANSPSPDKILVIITDKLDAKATKAAWYQACEKIGVTVTLWPITGDQLPQWIMARAKKANCTLTINAVKLLADYVEGNLVAASQAIEKLSLLSPKKPIDETSIESMMNDESRYTIFDLVDHVIAGKKAKILHILETLKEDSTEPVLILWGLTRELRVLSDFAQQKMRGVSPQQLFQQYRIFPRRQPLIRQFLASHSATACFEALKHALQIDKIIKGAAPGNVWDSLALFCLSIS